MIQGETLMDEEHLFMATDGHDPATVEVKGHRILLLAQSAEILEEDMEFLGGDGIAQLLFEDGKDQALADLASQIGGGVVVAPPGISIINMLHDLHEQLPWIQ